MVSRLYVILDKKSIVLMKTKNILLQKNVFSVFLTLPNKLTATLNILEILFKIFCHELYYNSFDFYHYFLQILLNLSLSKLRL